MNGPFQILSVNGGQTTRNLISEDKMIFQNLEFPRHFLKNEEKTWDFRGIFLRKNGGISNTFSKNSVNFRAYFEFNGISEALFFTKNSVVRRGYTENFWNGPMLCLLCERL